MCVQTSRARDKHLSWGFPQCTSQKSNVLHNKKHSRPLDIVLRLLFLMHLYKTTSPVMHFSSEKSDRPSSASKRYINLLIKSDVNYFHKCHNNKRCQRLHERNICPYFDSRHILLDGVNKSSKMHWFLFHRLFKSLNKCFCVQQPQKKHMSYFAYACKFGVKSCCLSPNFRTSAT